MCRFCKYNSGNDAGNDSFRLFKSINPHSGLEQSGMGMLAIHSI